MKNKTKKIFIGGSLLLALLTPTIMATEQFKNIENVSIEKELKSEPASSVEQIEVHVQEDDGYGEGSTKIVYEADTLHEYHSSYNTSDGNRANLNIISDVKMDVKFKVDKEEGIYLPRIENYSDSTHPTITDDIDYEFLFVPTVIVEKGQQAVIDFASIPNIKTQSQDDYSSMQYFYSQNYDGETGVSFVLKELDYNGGKIVEPIIFHLTWDESLNNGSKMGKSSIYYKHLKDDYVDLNFKTKTLNTTKSYGMAERYDFNLRSALFINNFYANDISDGEQINYYSSMYSNSFYYEYLLNSISNTINFKSIDLSEKNVNLQIEKIFGSNSGYLDFEMKFPTFYDIKPLDEVLTPEQYSEFETVWNGGVSNNSYLTDDLDWVKSRNTKYNNKHFVGNEDFNIDNSLSDIFIGENDRLYVSEKIKIDYDHQIEYSDLYSYKNATLEIANFIKGDIFKQMIESTMLWIGSSDVTYGYSTTENMEYTGYTALVYEMDDSAKFMTSPQWVLITFTILSIIGLIIIIILLIKSSNKEEDGIEIAGGAE